MRIGYDARALASQMRTGIGNYAYHLISAIADHVSKREMFLFLPRGNLPGDVTGMGVRCVRSCVPPDLREDRFYFLWFDLYLPLRARWDGIELFHGLSYIVPKVRSAPQVVTIYDCVHEKYPEWTMSPSPEFSRRVRDSVRRAAAVIAISEKTREDIIDVYGIDEKRVRVVYCGISERFRRMEGGEALENFRTRMRLPGKFILSIVSLNPRKNIRGLVNAFSLFKKKTGAPHSLVLAGKGYGSYDPVKDLKKEGAGRDLIYIGYVHEAELPLLYNLADLFAFPSFYEGFGLPPLEAMACGVPVISSKGGSLPEVAGDAAIYFDPENHEEMAGALEVALRSDECARLREKGMRRARMFSWDRAARETLSLYEELV